MRSACVMFFQISRTMCHVFQNHTIDLYQKSLKVRLLFTKVFPLRKVATFNQTKHSFEISFLESIDLLIKPVLINKMLQLNTFRRLLVKCNIRYKPQITLMVIFFILFFILELDRATPPLLILSHKRSLSSFQEYCSFK